jgi:hypothetical protein
MVNFLIGVWIGVLVGSVSVHVGRMKRYERAILWVLEREAPMGGPDIAEIIGAPRHAIYSLLWRLYEQGRVHYCQRGEHGVYFWFVPMRSNV